MGRRLTVGKNRVLTDTFRADALSGRLATVAWHHLAATIRT